MFQPDNPHYSIGEELVCVNESNPADRLSLTVRAPAGRGSFASVWAVTAHLGTQTTGLLAARTAWTPNHWMTDHSADLRRLDRYRQIVALTCPPDPRQAMLTHDDEVIPGLVTHYGLYVSAHEARGQDVYVALMPYLPMTIAQIVDGPAGGVVSTRIGEEMFTAPARPQGFAYAEALSSARTIARGVAELHRREMIHRDISCDNTLFRPDGMVVVGDLNLAALLTEGHYRGSLDRGKGFYSPPEMLRAEQAGRAPDLTKASDVWQLGVLLSRLFTGSWPYPTNHWQEFERLCLVPPGPSTLSPALRSVAEPVRDLIVECLDPEPANRPTIDTVCLRLEAAREQAPPPPGRDSRRLVTAPVAAPVAAPGPPPQPASAATQQQPAANPAPHMREAPATAAADPTTNAAAPTRSAAGPVLRLVRTVANLVVFGAGVVAAFLLAALVLAFLPW